jgi:quercetin 2,3-dioxygenase
MFNCIIQFNMKTTIRKAEERGKADHGWLQANFSFSFANFQDPSKIHFGALRVLNDDTIAAGMGFGTHPHDNMEIVTIPLSGTIRHKDSMGNEGDINYGDVQVMSAGSGIQHSEFNPNSTKEAKTLQIWLFSNVKDVKPRYDQQSFDLDNKINEWTKLVVPYGNEGMYIHQNAWFTFGQFEEGNSTIYNLYAAKNGGYLFLIDGQISIDNKILKARDAMEIIDFENVKIDVLKKSRFLFIEVPMQW